MNAQTKVKAVEGLALLREPFPANLISKLPKPTKKQTEEVRADYKKGVRCEVCGGWHHPKVVHVDYVGHAALTDRLLDADPHWNWKPMATDEHGLPILTQDGGLWIWLTVCDQTRPGVGYADGKQGGDAMKERIGDALRNAAMRFGAALDLWHKGDLHDDSSEAGGSAEGQGQEGKVSPGGPTTEYAFPEGPARNITELKGMARALWREIEGCGDNDELNALLDTKENRAVTKQLAALENPSHRELWDGDGKDNPGLAKHIINKQTQLAQHIADIARV